MDVSDDSFAWADTSIDSDDSSCDMKQENCEGKSETIYKTKAQEELQKDVTHKKKAKKRKHEESVEVEEDIKPKHIKSESDSDFEKPKKKKKKKRNENSANNKETLESTDYDESYLNYKVKEEQISSVEPVRVKSKKKKRHKEESETVTEESEIVAEEIGTQNHIISIYDKSEISRIENISCINNSIAVNNYLDDDQVKEKRNGDVNNELTEIESNAGQITTNCKPVKKIPKISDRLKFEDEDSIDFSSKENVEDTHLSLNLKQFLISNSDLSIVKSVPETETILTEDDKIWIIKAPHEISVEDFKDKNIKFDTKSKLKFNRQTYDLVSDNSIQKVPILSDKKNKTYVQHVSVMGLINLRKRIPKAHIPEENVTINNQINFIPLPETKCRHPLFGVNYKKASKISPSIAERLNDSVTSLTINGDREKRKKHKKEKRKIEVESEPETKPLDEVPVISSKKKRKRKSSIKEEPVTKKAKYIKHEQESADIWESEQAIEKNLFDF